ncbi:MAG: ABC transporter permease [Desulfovibrio sp.]|nr:ABC transporter permease [Desulfovibrio sp.]
MKSPFACFLQTLRACVTDMSCAPFFLVAVLFYAFYYCWPYQAQLPEHIYAAIIDEDQSPLSRRLVQSIIASPDFRVLKSGVDRPAAIEMMKKGEISSIIGIPSDFEKDALNGVPTAITLVTNGAFLVVARMQVSGASAVLARAAAEAVAFRVAMDGESVGDLALATLDNAPLVVTQAMYNDISGYLSFAVSIVFVIIFQSIMLCGLCMLLNDWFSRPVYPDPLVLSFGSPRYLFALIAPVMCICFFWVLFVEGFAFAWHGINSFQNIPATLLCGGFFAWAISSLGLLIGMLFKNSRFAIHAIIISSLPCVFISGNLFPWNNIPVYARLLAWFFPSTPGSDCMLRASQAGATPDEIYPYLVHMLFLGIIYFILAWLVSRKYKGEKGESAMADQERSRAGLAPDPRSSI